MLATHVLPLELARSMFIGMDPPKHDRLKALFQRGFTPKRIAEHEDEIRSITRVTLERLDGRDTCGLVADVAQPVVSRVIGRSTGISPQDDPIWANLMNRTLGADDPDLNPEIFERCSKIIAARRTPHAARRTPHAARRTPHAARRENPTDDLTSVLVHADLNRDENVYEDPDRFDLRRRAEHQAFGAGGRHFCLGTALARLELRILFEETLARFPDVEIAGEPPYAVSQFINQLKSLPVRLQP